MTRVPPSRQRPGCAAGRQRHTEQATPRAATMPKHAGRDIVAAPRRAPRVGVEPTSLVLIQSQAGPAGRPTGERCARESPRHTTHRVVDPRAASPASVLRPGRPAGQMARVSRDQAAPKARTPRGRMTGAQRREQLIGIGRQLFANRGYEATTVEEIASAAGVSKPVVYEHFGGKEGLYAVVVDREIQALLGAIAGALTSEGGSRALLERAATALLDYIETSTDGFRILVRDSPPGQQTGNFASLMSDVASQVEHLLAAQFTTAGPRPQAGPDVRADARRHGRAHRPVVAREPQGQEARRRRRPGQPRLERPHRPRAEADDHPPPDRVGTAQTVKSSLGARHLLELDAVADRVVGVEALGAGDLVVPAHLSPGAGDRGRERRRRRRRRSTGGPCVRGRSRSSTPQCSSCSPAANQTPPRAARTGGFGISGMPADDAVEVPQQVLAACRAGDLDVVQAEDAHETSPFRATAKMRRNGKITPTSVRGYAARSPASYGQERLALLALGEDVEHRPQPGAAHPLQDRVLLSPVGIEDVLVGRLPPVDLEPDTPEQLDVGPGSPTAGGRARRAAVGAGVVAAATSRMRAWLGRVEVARHLHGQPPTGSEGVAHVAAGRGGRAPTAGWRW